jgi:multidrug resistance efflux pump
VLLLAGVAAVLFRLQSGARDESALVQVNGRIEGDLIAVSPKTAGRVAELPVREGDEVEAGQVVARLADVGTEARLAEARSSAVALDAQAAAQQSTLQLLRAETSVQLATARAELEAVRAELRRVQAAVAQEGRDLNRIRDLAAQGFVGPQAVEKSELALRTAREQEAAARAAVARGEQRLRDAELRPLRISAREAEVEATRAQARAAAAHVEEAASHVADLTVSAPVAGRISNRYVNLGEVVAPGRRFSVSPTSRASTSKPFCPSR